MTAPATSEEQTVWKGCSSHALYLGTYVLCAVFFLVARLVFGVPVDHPQKVLLAVVSVAVAFVGIMMFLAALGKTERGMASVGCAVIANPQIYG